MLVNQEGRPISSTELDELLTQAEVSTEAKVDDKLWDRLEAKLEVDVHKSKSRRYKRFSIISSAACLLLLIGIFFFSQNTKKVDSTWATEEIQNAQPKNAQYDDKKFIIEEMHNTQHMKNVYNVDDITLLHKNNYSCMPC